MGTPATLAHVATARYCYLSHQNLELAMEGNVDLYVGWFLGPRSPFEISHIRNLRVDLLKDKDEKALNRLLRAIGSSLIQVEFHLPFNELGFDIKLEYNSNIGFLSLTNIDIDEVGAVGSFGTAWLQRFLSNIDTSNKLELIELGLAFDSHTFEEAYSAPGWGQIDCILSGKFLKLEQLNMELLLSTDPEVYNEFEQCMLDALPLLVKRGVSVDVWCKERP
ncbi:hypothetical protein JB92DRAFT_2969062, partial [Gautieria morchelliformis]